jgi:hypothetical protein
MFDSGLQDLTLRNPNGYTTNLIFRRELNHHSINHESIGHNIQ